VAGGREGAAGSISGGREQAGADDCPCQEVDLVQSGPNRQEEDGTDAHVWHRASSNKQLLIAIVVIVLQIAPSVEGLISAVAFNALPARSLELILLIHSAHDG